MVIITSKKTADRKQLDYYPTPDALAESIVRKYVHARARLFLDPGCGTGVFGKALRTQLEAARIYRIDGVDVEDRHAAHWYSTFTKDDFLTLEMPVQYDCVIGNPPYNAAEAFVRKAYSLLRNEGEVIFLLKLAFLESKGRARSLFKELSPTEVHVLAGRPSFNGTGKTNDYAFAVFVWRKPYSEFMPKTLLDWLEWN